MFVPGESTIRLWCILRGYGHSDSDSDSNIHSNISSIFHGYIHFQHLTTSFLMGISIYSVSDLPGLQ